MALVESVSKLKRGNQAPDFSLPGVDRKTHALEDFKDAKATLIIFMCNHCPYVKPKIEAIKKIQTDYKDQGLVVIGINPNDENFVPEDNMEGMQAMAQEKEINFIYLRDESQEIAKEYGATCTPDPFLFDAEHKLVFHSRLDAHHGKEDGSGEEMHQAIGEFLAGNDISVEEMPSMGCSIKWK